MLSRSNEHINGDEFTEPNLSGGLENSNRKELLHTCEKIET